MGFIDYARGVFSEGLAHVLGHPGTFVVGVDPDGKYKGIKVDPSGNISTSQSSQAGTANVTSINDSASNQTLLAANTNRLMAMIFNDSSSDLYLKFGAVASPTSFTVKILSGGYFEFPLPVYTGIVDGIWSADSTGAARITELTA